MTKKSTWLIIAVLSLTANSANAGMANESHLQATVIHNTLIEEQDSGGTSAVLLEPIDSKIASSVETDNAISLSALSGVAVGMATAPIVGLIVAAVIYWLL